MWCLAYAPVFVAYPLLKFRLYNKNVRSFNGLKKLINKKQALSDNENLTDQTQGTMFTVALCTGLQWRYC